MLSAINSYNLSSVLFAKANIDTLCKELSKSRFLQISPVLVLLFTAWSIYSSQKLDSVLDWLSKRTAKALLYEKIAYTI